MTYTLTLTTDLDPLGLGEGVKVGGGVKVVCSGRGGSRSRVKGGEGSRLWVKVGVKVGVCGAQGQGVKGGGHGWGV